MSIRRRVSDQQTLTQFIIALSVGFFGSLFGAYIMVHKMSVHIDYLRESVEIIAVMSEKQNNLDKRLAVVENEIMRSK